MEKTSNKTQHHDCHGTTEFISSGRAILIHIHPPTMSAGDKNLDWAFPLYTNCGQSTATCSGNTQATNQLSFAKTL